MRKSFPATMTMIISTLARAAAWADEEVWVEAWDEAVEAVASVEVVAMAATVAGEWVEVAAVAATTTAWVEVAMPTISTSNLTPTRLHRSTPMT